jgi:hypothetical protein
MTVTQLLKEYKVVYIGLLLGFLFKVIFNIPMMHLFNNLGLYPFYGSITTSILGFLISSLLCLTYVVFKYRINLKPTVKVGLKLFLGVAIMVGVMYLMHLIGLPLQTDNRLLSLGIAILYSGIGGSIYLLYMQYTNCLEDIFGKDNMVRIKNTLKKFKLR